MATCDSCGEWCPNSREDPDTYIAICRDCEAASHDYKYRSYLKSDEWKSVRRRKLFDADFKCERCGRLTGLEVHHKTYDRLGAERMEDLAVLCRVCHRQEHGRS